MTTSAFDVELDEVSKDWRRPVAGPLARVADANASRFDRKAKRKAKKGDDDSASKNRRLASRSRSEARQFRKIKDGDPVCKSAFGVEKAMPERAKNSARGAAGGAVGAGIAGVGAAAVDARRAARSAPVPRHGGAAHASAARRVAGLKDFGRTAKSGKVRLVVAAGGAGGALGGLAAKKRVSKSAFGVERGHVAKSYQERRAAAMTSPYRGTKKQAVAGAIGGGLMGDALLARKTRAGKAQLAVGGALAAGALGAHAKQVHDIKAGKRAPEPVGKSAFGVEL